MIILDNVALDWLKKNIENNMEYYLNNREPWIDQFVEGLKAESFMQADETLISSNDPSLDTENAITLYENNKTLSTMLASSDHYWTTLAHTKYYKYMHS